MVVGDAAVFCMINMSAMTGWPFFKIFIFPILSKLSTVPAKITPLFIHLFPVKGVVSSVRAVPVNK
jgi:hypothetical protein